MVDKKWISLARAILAAHAPKRGHNFGKKMLPNGTLRFPEPAGTFACPICAEPAPHEHSGIEIAEHRNTEKQPAPVAQPAEAVPDLKLYRIDLSTGKDHEDPDGGYFRDTDVQQRIGYREAQVDDLSALVERLVRKLRSAGQDGAVADGAMDYLRRHNLIGSPLRVAPTHGVKS
jgi:hypothetical protein